MNEITLDEVFRNIIDVLEDQHLTYLVIGGVAAGIIGEARATQDIDILISIKDKDFPKFLKTAEAKGFKFDVAKIKETKAMQGMFRFMYGPLRIDFIIGLMPFEESAFSRHLKIKLYDKTTSFPTPEDLILFKLLAGREKDIFDIKGLLIRHKGKLDLVYMKKWAPIIDEDLQTHRISKTLNQLLNSVYNK